MSTMQAEPREKCPGRRDRNGPRHLYRAPPQIVQEVAHPTVTSVREIDVSDDPARVRVGPHDVTIRPPTPFGRRRLDRARSFPNPRAVERGARPERQGRPGSTSRSAWPRGICVLRKKDLASRDAPCNGRCIASARPWSSRRRPATARFGDRASSRFVIPVILDYFSRLL
jgi:hypothetical protein